MLLVVKLLVSPAGATSAFEELIPANEGLFFNSLSKNGWQVVWNVRWIRMTMNDAVNEERDCCGVCVTFGEMQTQVSFEMQPRLCTRGVFTGEEVKVGFSQCTTCSTGCGYGWVTLLEDSVGGEPFMNELGDSHSLCVVQVGEGTAVRVPVDEVRGSFLPVVFVDHVLTNVTRTSSSVKVVAHFCRHWCSVDVEPNGVA